MTLKEFFHILPRPGGYTLEHRSVFADNNALVAVLFTVNYCLYIHDVGVLTFTHFFNADGNSVRNFSVKISKYLFTDHLRRNNTFGLIGQSVLGEEKHALLGKLFKLIKKLLSVDTPESRDRNNRFKIIDLGKLKYSRHQHLLVGKRINLVYRKDNGHFHLLEFFNQFKLGRSKLTLRLNNEKAGVNSCNAVGNSLYHLFAELSPRSVKAGSVGKNELSIALCKHTHYLCSGCLRLFRNNRNLLS